MWTERQVEEDLQHLGLRAGMAVLVHAIPQAIGPMEGGSVTLLNALLRVLGLEGTVLLPAFTPAHRDPAERTGHLTPTEETERLRATVPLFDVHTSPVGPEPPGEFPEIARNHPRARRSTHPILSFVAIGAQADFLTRQAPFHYPLGSESPLARLHQLNGYVLLIGTDHTANVSLHLSEVWANVPYIHRYATVRTGEATWTRMQGSPECRRGFARIEPLLRQSRILREGTVGNALAQLMAQQQLVSMGVALLRGERSFLLCEAPDCSWCALARRMNAEPATQTMPWMEAPEHA